MKNPTSPRLRRARVFVAMSGGVDSSVAAALLKERGFDVIGCHIKCYNLDGCGEKDADDARRVAEQLNISFYVFDLEQEYKDRVVNYMINEYRAGRTPNPDVMCNKEIKFGLFLQRALQLGADYVATGHYVRLSKSGGADLPSGSRIVLLQRQNFLLPRPAGLTSFGPSPAGLRDVPSDKSAPPAHRLFQARDKNKDQSYFLWTLTQEQLKRCLFPIGEYTKPEVRQLAKKFGLITADKKDSQGICFLGRVTLADFLKSYIPEKRGVVLAATGEKVGEHGGAHLYTIGQRRGLGLGGLSAPAYVAEKDMAANALIVAEGENNPALYQKEIKLRDVNFINPKLEIVRPRRIRLWRKNCLPAIGLGLRHWQAGKLEILARVRYRQPLAPATLKMFYTPNSNEYVQKLIFEKPQKFIAPGQSAVFYSREGELLGGGIIIR